MPLFHAPRRHPAQARARRRARLQDALARVPAPFLRGTDAEAVRVRAEAFGVEPGRLYGPSGRVEAGADPLGYQPYVGELGFYGFNFAPQGWALCSGQLLAIAENDVLFVLIGTTYGGDGQETFALPDLRGRFPVHQGTGPDNVTYPLANADGVETVMLTQNQLPAHTHGVAYAIGAGSQPSPVGAIPASVPAGGRARYAPTTAGAMAPLTPAGGSQPHENMAPFLTIQVAISLYGVFPSQT